MTILHLAVGLAAATAAAIMYSNSRRRSRDSSNFAGDDASNLMDRDMPQDSGWASTPGSDTWRSEGSASSLSGPDQGLSARALSGAIPPIL